MITETITAREAFSIPLQSHEDGRLPEDIQYMPPGESTINARDKSGKAITRTVLVHQATAQRLESSLQGIRSRAAAGQEDLPYIDFNHSDEEAAGHILAFSWGGDDPVTGGVRAKVRWTEPGKAALVGRAYRRFSPVFSVDAAGEVVGTSVNMGGLVNRAAFKTITPIWSRAGDPDDGGQVNQPKGPDSMDPTKELADLRAANAALQTQVTDITAKLASASQAETITAKESEIVSLKAQVTDLQSKITLQAKEAAKALVDAAVKAGKVAPQNTELQAKLVDMIVADKSMAAVLDNMTPNPALAPQLTGGAAPTASAPGGKAEQFVTEVHAKLADKSHNRSSAIKAVVTEKPELYAAWRAANGQPGL